MFRRKRYWRRPARDFDKSYSQKLLDRIDSRKSKPKAEVVTLSVEELHLLALEEERLECLERQEEKDYELLEQTKTEG